MKHTFRTVACLALFVSAATRLALAADDWPRFRGPNGTGIAASNASPPVTWSDTQNLRWKTPLPGPGSSSPIVVGQRVFVTCYSGYGDGSGGTDVSKLQRHLLCLERASGKMLWSKAVASQSPEDPYGGYITEHGYASNTPACDGERVYVFFGKTGVLAFDMEGKELWKTGVGQLSANRRWGSAASLLLYKNMVIVNAADESRSIRALDKLTGKEVWRAEGGSLELCYGTPMLLESGQAGAELVIAVPNEVWGLSADTGKLRWFAETGIGGNVSPSVVGGNGVVYATGGYPKQGSLAVKAGGKGDVTKTNILWTTSTASYVPTPVVLNGYLYVVTDQGFALCMDAATGKVVYKERMEGASAGGRGGKLVYASPVLAGGKVYAVSRRSGTFVIEAKPEFKVVAHNVLAGDNSDFNATPAVVDGELFLRSNRAVYCIAGGPAGGK